MVKPSSVCIQVITEKLEPVDYIPSKLVEDASSLSIHDVIKPLYYLSRLADLWPYKYEKNNNITSLTTEDKFKIWFKVFVYTLCFCWSIYSMSGGLSDETAAISVTTVVYLLFSHFFAIFSVVLMNSHFGELTKNFYLEYDQITKLYKVFSIVHIYQRLRQKFLLEIIIVISFVFGFHAFHIVLYLVHLSYLTILSNITTYIAQQILLIVYCQITTKVELLFESFLCINNTFSHSALFKNNTKTHSYLPIKLKLEQLKFLCQIHGRLCNLIHISNDMHGWQIVIMVFTVVTLILDYLYIALNYSSSSLKWSASICLIKLVISMAFYGALMIKLAVRCSAARKQALKTGLIANEILLEMELDDTDKSAVIYKERLQLLIGQISYRNPHFSAGGIFSVDYTTVSFIASTIVSYLLIFLSFTQNPICTFIVNGTNITQVQQ